MIYVIQEHDSGDTKIGWSINPEARMRTLQGERTGKLEILRALAGPRWAEFWFHRQFKDHRIAREWFRFHPDMLIIEPPDEKPEREIVPMDTMPRPVHVRFSGMEKERTISTRLPLSLWGAVSVFAGQHRRSAVAELAILVQEALDARDDGVPAEANTGPPSGPPPPAPSFSHGRADEVTTRFKSGAKA